MEGESRVLGEFTLKKSYLNCLKKIRQFRKALTSDKDIKRGRLYFEDTKKLPTQLEFIKYLKNTRKDVIVDYANYVIKILKPNCINELIESFNDEIISKKRKKLLEFYLNKKIELLSDVFYEEDV